VETGIWLRDDGDPTRFSSAFCRRKRQQCDAWTNAKVKQPRRGDRGGRVVTHYTTHTSISYHESMTFRSEVLSESSRFLPCFKGRSLIPLRHQDQPCTHFYHTRCGRSHRSVGDCSQNERIFLRLQELETDVSLHRAFSS
jgi:hypothetical protein